MARGEDYIGHIETRNAKENAVNIIKHMEAAFVVALAAVGSVAYLAEAVPNVHAQPYFTDDAAVATSGKMAVVVVTGKRQSDDEKLALLMAERRDIQVRM